MLVLGNVPVIVMVRRCLVMLLAMSYVNAYDNCTSDSECDSTTQHCSFNLTCECKHGYTLEFNEYTSNIHGTYNEKCKGTHGFDCQYDGDCQSSFICSDIEDFIGRCNCPVNQFFMYDKCYKKVNVGGRCQYSRQCTMTTTYSECINDNDVGRCQCRVGFVYRNSQCRYERTGNSKTALEVYKITMILASTCLGLVLVLFIACILRRSYCPGASRHYPPLDNSVDIFTLFPEAGAAPDQTPFNVRPPYEKPPSYDESQRHMLEELGVPPPAYSSGAERPTLNIHTEPGPSGENSDGRRQRQPHDIGGGIDNPVFNPQE